MNDLRLLKKQCMLEILQETLAGVEMIINTMDNINNHPSIDEHIRSHDLLKTSLDLELMLASLCIIIRKMSENQYIVIKEGLRRDINSIIHSNRFEYNNHILIVHSQKGKEEVILDELIEFSYNILTEQQYD